MGWGRMLLLGNFGQQLDIHDSKRELERLRGQLTAKRRRLVSVEAELERLSSELDESKLYIAAISRILVDRGLLSAEELDSLVRTVDADAP